MAFSPNPTGGAGRSIAQGTSPWQSNVTFTITGHRFVNFHEDGKPVDAKARDIPVFVATLTKPVLSETQQTALTAAKALQQAGQALTAEQQALLASDVAPQHDLFLSMLRKGKPVFGGGVIKPSGSLARLVEKTIRDFLAATPQATDAQIMAACATACSGKVWRCVRVPYQGIDSNGKSYAAEFVNFVDNATGELSPKFTHSTPHRAFGLFEGFSYSLIIIRFIWKIKK